MRIAKRDRPPIDLHLVTAEVSPGNPWFRFVLAQHPDPLGYGRGCKSRFADAELDQRRPARFEPLYFGSTFRSCFVETVLRDRASGQAGDWPLPRRALTAWTCAQIELTRPLKVVDLTSTGPVGMRMPSDAVRARHQQLGRIWSTAFHAHSDRVDGILYPSRFVQDACLCIYADRALDALKLTARDILLYFPTNWRAYLMPSGSAL
jgi:RES domain